MRLVQTISLFTATIATGLMAGLFYSFSIAVMPALHKSSDRTFVEAMQRINVAILNGWFMLCFIGALLLLILATAVSFRGSGRAALPWIIAALVLYIAMLAITSGVNVPLNNDLNAAGNPDHISNLVAVRQHFESRWNTWNLARTLVNTAAFVVLGWALIVQSRAQHSNNAADTTRPAAYAVIS
jgi:uncharacterized membrane protein